MELLGGVDHAGFEVRRGYDFQQFEIVGTLDFAMLQQRYLVDAIAGAQRS